MRLLPYVQTMWQRSELLRFLQTGECVLQEPRDCGSQIRHNNGGNYHRIIHIRMDAGKCWRMETYTGDYAPNDNWREVKFSEAIDEVAQLSAEGWQ